MERAAQSLGVKVCHNFNAWEQAKEDRTKIDRRDVINITLSSIDELSSIDDHFEKTEHVFNIHMTGRIDEHSAIRHLTLLNDFIDNCRAIEGFDLKVGSICPDNVQMYGPGNQRIDSWNAQLSFTSKPDVWISDPDMIGYYLNREGKDDTETKTTNK